MTFERPITFMNKVDSLSLPTIYYIKESKSLFPSDKLKYSIINSKGKKLNRVKIVDGNFDISDKKGAQLVEFNLNSIKEQYDLSIHFKKSNNKRSIKIRQGRLWEGGSVYGIEFFNEKTQEIDYISVLLNIQSYEVQDFTIFDHNFDWNAFEDYDINGFKDLCDSNVIAINI
ncbi:hypothetical protein LY90DRAFT_172829 [Neocallimastix californiae]|uniref:Uncharacterized protein n=1 Tax=Neocallimastix californiae TaxID=1754190 RepID=A0A1Y2EQI3_9FUNG|nr:hypothetical protein LY90DRAFT_172829 [Neocallimastix californiae]|eukprot:ORY73554.1 hypothetical protein LY90DRAFT_172829 [Neocallimastix californiae]